MPAQDWRHLLEEVRKNPGSRNFHAVADGLCAEGDLDGARKVCERGLEFHPNHLKGWSLLAQIHSSQGNHRRAIVALERVLRVSPEDVSANGQLGEAWEALGDKEQAAKYYRIASIFAPDNSFLQERLRTLQGAAAGAGNGTIPLIENLPLAEVAPEDTAPAILTPAPATEKTSPVPVLGPESIDGSIADLLSPGPDLFDVPPSDRDLLGEGDGRSEIPVTSTQPLAAPQTTVAVPAVQVASGMDAADLIDESEGMVRQLFPGSADGEEINSVSLAALYERKGNPGKAADIYRRVLLRDPANEDARSSLARLELGDSVPAAAAPPGIEIGAIHVRATGLGRGGRRQKVEHLRTWLKRVKGDVRHV